MALVSYVVAKQRHVYRTVIRKTIHVRRAYGMQLQRNAPTPLYEQLKIILAEQIKSGKFEADQQIPSERELCEKYGVSRITVRQAITSAVNDGWLYRTHGRGTFVANPKIEQPLKSVNNFKQTLVRQGLIATTRLLKAELVPGNFFLSHLLNISLMDQVMNIQLVGQGNDVPVVYYDSYFSSETGQIMMKEAQSASEKGVPFSTLDLYGGPNGIIPSHVEQTFEAILSDDDVSAMLQIPVHSPIFLVTSIVYDHERPLEFKSAYYRGDKYKFFTTRDFQQYFSQPNV
jgi:GntR family transcriptional regulator